MSLGQFFKRFTKKNTSSQYPEDLLSEKDIHHLNNTFSIALRKCESDPQQLFNLSKQYSEQGAPLALYHLGHFYEQGDGQQQYPELAAECFWRAGKQDLPEAQYSLALLYAQGTLGKVDLVSAFYWFSEAAKLGLSAAQFNLATFYEDGLGCVEDKSLAFQLYQQAADAGFTKAWHNLGVMYYSGNGVEQNKPLAYAWTLLAAKANVQEAKDAEPIMTAELTNEELVEGKEQLELLINKHQNQLPTDDFYQA
ncbi:tetratricopeptide repeat protein [Litoribacillus peritrichatus]|uniref:Sel1 repeat family protein n=1 Tax=Litoribacillus peritrichatus TaxID=718191 RepID=A0ABP7N720_9GAMM